MNLLKWFKSIFSRICVYWVCECVFYIYIYVLCIDTIQSFSKRNCVYLFSFFFGWFVRSTDGLHCSVAAHSIHGLIFDLITLDHAYNMQAKWRNTSNTGSIQHTQMYITRNLDRLFEMFVFVGNNYLRLHWWIQFCFFFFIQTIHRFMYSFILTLNASKI